MCVREGPVATPVNDNLFSAASNELNEREEGKKKKKRKVPHQPDADLSV